jgi:hypothetical protein
MLATSHAFVWPHLLITRGYGMLFRLLMLELVLGNCCQNYKVQIMCIVKDQAHS